MTQVGASQNGRGKLCPLPKVCLMLVAAMLATSFMLSSGAAHAVAPLAEQTETRLDLLFGLNPQPYEAAMAAIEKYGVDTETGPYFSRVSESAVSTLDQVIWAALINPAEAAPTLRRLYSFQFPVASRPLNGPAVYIRAADTNRAVNAAFRELRRCFNCSFPVGGAPREYPRPAQLLPLRICVPFVGPDPCFNAAVRFYPEERLSGWYFVAERGHFDGEGSKIYFRLWEDGDRGLQLSVDADVANPRLPDPINREGARVTWFRFASDLGGNMYQHQGCRPTCR